MWPTAPETNTGNSRSIAFAAWTWNFRSYELPTLRLAVKRVQTFAEMAAVFSLRGMLLGLALRGWDFANGENRAPGFSPSIAP
jgi:hypothetical protein